MPSPMNTSRWLKRRAVLAAAVGVVALAYGANALAEPDPVELAVVDRDTGQPLKIWRHQGRLYVAGDVGARYSLRVTNHTEGRVLVVMSVDGVNIFTGETAGYNQRGYIFYPHQSYDVEGWRKSLTEVADFTFAPLPQSYAARTGRPHDVGVIGIAVFDERAAPQAAAEPSLALATAAPPPPTPPLLPPPPAPRPDRSPTADLTTPALPLPPVPHPQAESIGPPQPAPRGPIARRSSDGMLAARSDEKLGTAHGRLERSVTYTIPFQRATPDPQSVRQIEYDTFERLVASGVIPRSLEHRPRAFPGPPAEPGFVPDPPGDH